MLQDIFNEADKLLSVSLNDWGLTLVTSDALNPVWLQTLADPFLRRLLLRYSSFFQKMYVAEFFNILILFLFLFFFSLGKMLKVSLILQFSLSLSISFFVFFLGLADSPTPAISHPCTYLCSQNLGSVLRVLPQEYMLDLLWYCRLVHRSMVQKWSLYELNK